MVKAVKTLKQAIDQVNQNQLLVDQLPIGRAKDNAIARLNRAFMVYETIKIKTENTSDETDKKQAS